MRERALQWRITKNWLFVGFLFLFAALTAVPLVFIIYYIVKNGIGAINWDFLSRIPKPVGESGGGIINAIVGTVMLIVNAALIATPIGVLAGVYLSQYPNTRLAKISGLFVEILQGIPSIVIGIVAYVWLVEPIGNFSALSGSAALAIMMLPVIVRTNNNRKHHDRQCRAARERRKISDRLDKPNISNNSDNNRGNALQYLNK